MKRRKVNSWCRPLVPEPEDRLQFQQLDLDHRGKDKPVIYMYGATATGNSVLCRVHGFSPYFYCKGTVASPTILRDWLNKELKSPTAVLKVEPVLRESIMYYSDKGKIQFLKITVCSQRWIRLCRQLLENTEPARECFETNLEYNLRFMVDTGVFGCNWVDVPYRPVVGKRESRAQIEVDIQWHELVSHAPENEWLKVAPIRILSFDIECAGRPGIFPEPLVDPVIQIASVLSVQGETISKVIFTLGTCAAIQGAEIFSYQDELEMLEAWTEFVQEADPDVLTGYNISNFDLAYLMDRATHLDSVRFAFLGRLKDEKSFITVETFSSKAYGTRENRTVLVEGRIPFDMLKVIQRDYKLRSYSLNGVSAHFLGEQKEDVHHSIITSLHQESDETRRRLAVYCLKDAVLPLRLMEKLMCLVNYMEMARVTGVPFRYLLARGQQIKVMSQLMRRTKMVDMVIPVYEQQSTGDDDYEGATVIQPKKGFYDTPIATLDFSSLYPSIMMAHNLCYSTLLRAETEGAVQTPTGDWFVPASTRRGIMPVILEELLAARKRAKADLKKETDPFKRAVLDGRQLALKVSCNSVYGFTGAVRGKLPCLQISASVTAYGREMIETTRAVVERTYCIANNYSHDAEVIYGDTDSVMVKFGLPDLADTLKLAQEAAVEVTKHFKRPINLEFEKVYYPYLLINKKRYAGLYWTKADHYDKMDAKGIVTVRRDNCRLVVTLINTCLRKLLIERDVPGAIDYAKSVIADLLCDRIDISQLVITKALTKTREGYKAKQAHVELAERMRKRDAGSAPALGDRVAYVIIKGPKNAKAYEKSEDPIYVLDNSIPIDTKHYLKFQLSKPLLGIFEPIMGEAKAASLLTGEHTRTVTKTASKSTLSRFIVARPTCYGCHVPGKTICNNCRPRLSELYQKKVAARVEMEQTFARLWSQCQRCQGSLLQPVLCSNSDCPIFYRRQKVKRELVKDDAVILE